MDLTAVAAQIVAALDAAGIPYMFVGGLPAIVYGRPRLTVDIDLVVAITRPDVPRLVRELRRRKCRIPAVLADEFGKASNVLVAEAGPKPIRVDMWALKTEFDQDAFARRRRMKLGALHAWLIGPEHLVAKKLHEGRAKDHDDALAILVNQRGRLDDLVLRHAAALLNVTDELRRFQRLAAKAPRPRAN